MDFWDVAMHSLPFPRYDFLFEWPPYSVNKCALVINTVDSLGANIYFSSTPYRDAPNVTAPPSAPAYLPTWRTTKGKIGGFASRLDVAFAAFQ